MYKAAVIGLGNIGMLYDLEPQRPHPSTHVFAYEMSPFFDLVCGIDGDKDRREVFREKTTNAEFCTSIDGAIESGILKEMDVISICTPPNTHLEILLKLLRSHIGRILFCEKPIVSNLEEAKKLYCSMESNKDVVIIPNISRRWNIGLNNVTDVICSKCLGEIEKIHVRYTRGIRNTGSHLFDLLKMWSDERIKRVSVMSETKTSAWPEPTYNFYFELENGAYGLAEGFNDRNYYLFEVDVYLSSGKIEMRNSGDDITYYKTTEHHLFKGFKELMPYKEEINLLQDACMKHAIDNIADILEGNGKAKCTLEDAVYPIYVSEKLQKSFTSKCMEELDYGEMCHSGRRSG